jgi:receptor protein-tyrosine kinase
LTVQEFAKILRTRWKIVCATILIAVVGAFAYALLGTPQYESSTRLFVSGTAEGGATEANDGSLFAQRRVLSYLQLLRGEILAQRTIDKLGLDMDAGELQAKLEATAPTDTVLIDVKVLDSSPGRARDIANTLSDEFIVMAAGLETPELGAAPNARVIVQQRANLAANRTGPESARNAVLAAVLGALLGIVAAIVRDRLDGRVGRPEALEKVTGVGLLADIPVEAHRHDGPLIAFGGEPSTLADSFRELRTNLQVLEVADGPRVLLVASSVPGEGRTTTAINLALALTEAGYTVVLVDGDLRRPRIASSLGISEQVGLSTVLAGEAVLAEALQETRFPRLAAITSGAVPSNSTELLGSRATKDVLGELGTQFDYVIVDTPSLQRPDAVIQAVASQGVLMIARFGTTRAGQLAQGIETLKRAGAPLLGTVLTMTPAKKRLKDDDYQGRRRSHGKN